MIMPLTDEFDGRLCAIILLAAHSRFHLKFDMGSDKEPLLLPKKHMFKLSGVLSCFPIFPLNQKTRVVHWGMSHPSQVWGVSDFAPKKDPTINVPFQKERKALHLYNLYRSTEKQFIIYMGTCLPVFWTPATFKSQTSTNVRTDWLTFYSIWLHLQIAIFSPPKKSCPWAACSNPRLHFCGVGPCWKWLPLWRVAQPISG